MSAQNAASRIRFKDLPEAERARILKPLTTILESSSQKFNKILAGLPSFNKIAFMPAWNNEEMFQPKGKAITEKTLLLIRPPESRSPAKPANLSPCDAKTLKELRKKRGLTQQQIAQSLNVSIRLIAKWENGSVHPSLLNFLKLRGILGDEIIRIYNTLLL